MYVYFRGTEVLARVHLTISKHGNFPKVSLLKVVGTELLLMKNKDLKD